MLQNEPPFRGVGGQNIKRTIKFRGVGGPKTGKNAGGLGGKTAENVWI